MSRIALDEIRSLTLHRGDLTLGKRVRPIQQLKCVGSVCKEFQPEVVRCYNAGGQGIDVDWTVSIQVRVIVNAIIGFSVRRMNVKELIETLLFFFCFCFAFRCETASLASSVFVLHTPSSAKLIFRRSCVSGVLKFHVKDGITPVIHMCLRVCIHRYGYSGSFFLLTLTLLTLG